ncbi:ATP-binding protein [Vibrio vulnificus]|nr:sensor histidine kinase [Vibrio vulnificus]EHZ2754239.1 sensor histidine kinase [Vibrio vulnificus]EHZ2763288.1 sensor histidine kinase [Vibrio vulnificus]EKD8802962.1 sensor histidine kinase [Vibrio vulnificus]EKD9321566.1 sensor histidine kinase [Vibrio vulnificus]
MSQRTRIVLLFLVFYFICMGVSGHFIWNKSYQSLTQQHRSQLERFASHIQNKLDKFAHIPQLIAKDAPLIEALLHPQNSAQIDITNRYLEEVNQIIQAADTYLIDEYGNTIAASNWNIDRSFVGRNFAFRPYFKQAIVGQRSQYFALGSTSGQRGYYYSYPVTYAGSIIGVVVVKMELLSIEDNWREKRSVFVADDENQIVFMSSEPSWLFKSLTPKTEQQLQRIRDSQQYLDRTIESLNFVGDLHSPQSEIKQGSPYSAKTMIVSSLPLRNLDLTIRVLSAKHNLVFTTFSLLLVETLVFAVIFLLGQLYYHRQQRHKQIERLQQEAKQKLEFQVMERTAELQAEIAQRTKTEQALRLTQDELIQAAKLAVLGQMSASISHELNNPLAAIRSFADNGRLFLEKEKYPQVDENLSRISALTERMAKISQQLRSFARKSNGDELVEAKLTPILISANELMKPALKSARVQLDTQFPEQDIFVVINVIQLEQVLINLLTNAIEAMEMCEEKHLNILVEIGPSQTVNIHIDDNGPGIEPAKFAQLCEPFHTTKKNGLGLGLSISQQILAGMNGKLQVSHSPLGGARFTIMLPTINTEV